MAANQAPPASQYRSGLTTTWRKYEDLPADFVASCDDIIHQVNKAGGTSEREKPNDQTRKALWKRVFRDWDTDCPVPHPGPIRDRSAQESMVEIGTWKVDLPQPTTPSKRKAAGADAQPTPNPNPNRRHGALAFLKPSVGWDDCGVTFNVCDERGANANFRYVALKNNWTIQQARAEAIIRWDKCEASRVTRYNIELGVCWARSRALNFLRSQANAAPGQNDTSSTSDEVLVDFRKLVKLVRCLDRLREVVSLAKDCEAIASARPFDGAETFLERQD